MIAPTLPLILSFAQVLSWLNVMIVTHSFGLLDLRVLTNEFTLIRWRHCLTMVFEFSCEVLWAHRCVNKLMLFTSQITLVSILAVIISFGYGFS